MELLLLHPDLYTRDCNQCRKYMFTGDGEIKKIAGGTQNMRRPKQVPLPCERGNCPKGHYSNQKVLTDANYRTWLHYKRCKAVGSFPDDSLVAENARIIAEIEAYCEQTATDKIIRSYTGEK